MKIIFFGTPDYVLPILKDLYKNYEVVGVVTQPPKLVGRKQIKTYSPVDKWAYEHKIDVFYSPKDLLEKRIKADIGVLAAYGAIIPKVVIDLFPHGILNVHPSLLPKFRGASPVQAAIVSGEKETGVTIIKLDEKLDHGPIISQFKEEIFSNDTGETLRRRLFERSVEVVTNLLTPYIQGKIKPREQNHKEATYTKIITKKDAFIDLKKTNPEEAERFIRAMKPWPMAWTLLRLDGSSGQAKRLKILEAHLEEEKLILDRVQLEGKNPVSWEEFKRGYPEVRF